MSGSTELDDDLYARVVALTDQGNDLCERDQYEPARERFRQALELLPPPIEQWEAGLWLLVALGDAEFLLGHVEAALSHFKHAMQCPDALGNPFIHLRLGQCRFELGELDQAADELARAYMGGGPELFEDEPPRYLDFLRTRMRGI